jgi:hypothetical protein
MSCRWIIADHVEIRYSRRKEKNVLQRIFKYSGGSWVQSDSNILGVEASGFERHD